MSGTKIGGKQAAETNKRLYGDDFYQIQGRKGGLKSRGGGFAADLGCNCEQIEDDHKLAQCAGARGGRSIRRGAVA